MIFIGGHATDELEMILLRKYEIGHTVGSLFPHQ